VVPSALVGAWSGGGNPSGDSYFESLEVVLTADGRYSILRAGVLRDSGRCRADGTTIYFRPAGGQPYTMDWRIDGSGGSPVLLLLQRPGYVSALDKVG
jgi:hypothetical protein